MRLNSVFTLATALLLAFIFIRVPAGGADRAPLSRLALVIGNNRYEQAVGALRNPVNDAKAMSGTLRGLGFTVIEKHNVTRDELLKAVAQFRARLRGVEVGLFYFAGHGIQVSGANYLLPIKSGYEPGETDGTGLRLLAETKLFNAEQVVAEMNAAGAACNLVILDACRATPVARNPRARAVEPPGGLSEMNPPAGSLIAFATDAGRIAEDGAGTNGLYTNELVAHLRTRGLTIEQVFKRTRAGVMERSAGAQIPAEYSRLVGDDIFLAGLAPPAPEAAPLPALAEIERFAAAGDAGRCVESLRQLARRRGPGDYAAAPLTVLIEQVKENLRDATTPSPQVSVALKTCEAVLGALNECLPPNHPERAMLGAKAQNRRGDTLVILGRHKEALAAYDSALALAPGDSWFLYNRGRVHLALGREDEARADFTAAALPKSRQPGARKLALEALSAMKREQNTGSEKLRAQ